MATTTPSNRRRDGSDAGSDESGAGALVRAVDGIDPAVVPAPVDADAVRLDVPPPEADGEQAVSAAPAAKLAVEASMALRVIVARVRLAETVSRRGTGIVIVSSVSVRWRRPVIAVASTTILTCVK
jgi:hypothetical protein